MRSACNIAVGFLAGLQALRRGVGESAAIRVVLDAETGLNIAEPGACSAASYPNERPWDSSPGGAKPPFDCFITNKTASMT